jgi:hypothetical protein
MQSYCAPPGLGIGASEPLSGDVTELSTGIRSRRHETVQAPPFCGVGLFTPQESVPWTATAHDTSPSNSAVLHAPPIPRAGGPAAHLGVPTTLRTENSHQRCMFGHSSTPARPGLNGTPGRTAQASGTFVFYRGGYHNTESLKLRTQDGMRGAPQDRRAER